MRVETERRVIRADAPQVMNYEKHEELLHQQQLFRGENHQECEFIKNLLNIYIYFFIFLSAGQVQVLRSSAVTKSKSYGAWGRKIHFGIFSSHFYKLKKTNLCFP